MASTTTAAASTMATTTATAASSTQRRRSAHRTPAPVAPRPPKRSRAEQDDLDDEDVGSSDEDVQDDALAEAYGRGVMEQFGFDIAALSQTRTAQASSSKIKLEAGRKAPTKAETPVSAPSLQSGRRVPETVVFDGAGTSSSSRERTGDVQNTFVDSKAARKAFMSSRIERIGDETGTGKGKGRATAAKGDEEDNAQEKEHRANDRALSHLLSTTLFAAGADASSSPATKRNGKPSLDPSKGTLASILELTTTHEQRKGAALGRGWGDAQARVKELGKVPARLRDGLKRAAKERVSKEQERARELGLVHRSLNAGSKRKNMGGTGAVSAVDMALSGVGSSKRPRDRVRGLGMGVGKFGSGKLTISARDVEKINGPAPSRAPGAGRRGSAGPANKKQRR